MSEPALLREPEPKRQLSVGELLERRYAEPEWCLEGEVTLGTRRADWIAFNLWRHRILGFEVKASRADWLRELADYEKSVPTVEAVDAFFVIAPKGMVAVSEIPANSGWGLLEIKGNRLYTTVRATEAPRSTTMNRQLAARLLARQGSARQQIEWRREEEIRRKVRAEEKEQRDADLKQLRDQLASVRGQHETVLSKLGVRAHDWNPDKKAVQVANILIEAERVEDALRRNLERLAEIARDGLATLGGAA